MEFYDWLVRVKVPYHEFVIIATRSELLVVERPLQTANFLLVPSHFGKMRAWCSQISLQNSAVTATSAHNRLVPSDGTHTSDMTMQIADKPVVLGIPNLSVARMSSNSEVSTLLSPSNRRDCIRIWYLTKLLHSLIAR